LLAFQRLGVRNESGSAIQSCIKRYGRARSGGRSTFGKWSAEFYDSGDIMQKCFLLIFLCIFSASIQAVNITGWVVGVSDGDTITMLDDNNIQYKVRLAGIDAPEKKQAFGNASKKSLSDLIFSKQVIANWSKKDRYGRLIAKVTLNQSDINLMQIQRGMAWFYFKYQNELKPEDRIEYLHAHQNASYNRLGLWADDLPEAPWDFRKNKKK